MMFGSAPVLTEDGDRETFKIGYHEMKQWDDNRTTRLISAEGKDIKHVQ